MPKEVLYALIGLVVGIAIVAIIWALTPKQKEQPFLLSSNLTIPTQPGITTSTTTGTSNSSKSASVGATIKTSTDGNPETNITVQTTSSI